MSENKEYTVAEIKNIIADLKKIVAKQQEDTSTKKGPTAGYEEFLLKSWEQLLKEKKSHAHKKQFKRSGHLTDQILKYNYPKDRRSQLNLWETLSDATKKEISTSKIEVTEVVEGIKLSPSEQKIVDCLCKNLHENSQVSDPSESGYYTGNLDFDLVEYGGDRDTPAPKLAFTLYELAKEYKGGEHVGGKDIENVKNILQQLDTKKYLLSYIETTKKKGGGKIERKIEDYKKLIHIIKLTETEYSKDNVEIHKKEEMVVLLNPIFRRQIESKYILYPEDINIRTKIAYGSHNISDTSLRLRDYLIRELSSKRFTPEILVDRLYWLLNEKWMKESRKKKVREFTDKALETCKALGLLDSYEITKGATGDPKIIFHLNKDWE